VSVAIVITVFRNPERLSGLLDNMKWAGLPDIPVYVFEDPSPGEDRDEVYDQYQAVCDLHQVTHFTMLNWGCMQGIIDHAFRHTTEDWLIYVPDDIRFTRGGLWNEYAGVLTYGRDWVGGIQAPYWNATDLVSMGAIPGREAMWHNEALEGIPQNPHWNGFHVPRKYINLNGAGFSLSRDLYNRMGGFPQCTWRLDEWAGYQCWQQGKACITLPGPARVHYFGGATPKLPGATNYHTVAAWQQATGGLTPAETGNETALIMDQLPHEDWDSMLKFFSEGGKLHV
jgi:hypothetical protein